MSEQGITQDDERWITERDNEPGASFRTAMRAAIARGYERGKAEGAADRDRLAKRLESADAMIEMYRAKCEVFRERLHAAQPEPSDRLAALEQRVGELIDMEADVTSGAIGWTEYRSRLAALRAPRVATSPMDAEVLYQKVWDALKDVPTGGKFHAYEVVADVVAALATARREREEALGVVREVLAWRSHSTLTMGAWEFDAILSRARALVARGAGPSKLDAIMTEREAEIIGESFAAERELRAEIATLRISLAEAQGEVATERSKRIAAEHATGDTEEELLRVDRNRNALRAHALKLDALCERAASGMEDRGMAWAALAAAIRARGEVPR